MPSWSARVPAKAIILASTGLAVFGFVVLQRDPCPRCERDDSDYRYVVGQLGAREKQRVVDVGRVNGGDWQFLCVIGSYIEATDVLRDEAGRRQVTLKEIILPPETKPGLVFLDDPESAVAFVDGSGQGRILLFGEFQHIAEQHTHKRFDPGTREIALPPRSG